MRLTFLLLLAVVAFTPVADARPRTAGDDALIEKMLVHADKISAILEKDLESPKKALAALDRYLKKHRKAMKATNARLVTAIGELDEDPRSELKFELMGNERVQRFLRAISDFKDKHGEDPAYQKKIDARMGELETEGKKLLDALLQ